MFTGNIYLCIPIRDKEFYETKKDNDKKERQQGE